jgi:hypothetical protein
MEPNRKWGWGAGRPRLETGGDPSPGGPSVLADSRFSTKRKPGKAGAGCPGTRWAATWFLAVPGRRRLATVEPSRKVSQSILPGTCARVPNFRRPSGIDHELEKVAVGISDVNAGCGFLSTALPAHRAFDELGPGAVEHGLQ